MSILTADTGYVIGVDTHRDTHTAAVVAAGTGAVLAVSTCPATAAGYRQLAGLANEQTTGELLWAIEGTGSYGAGLTDYLLRGGAHVAEIERPKRPARHGGAKTDEIDAVRAAREALSRDHLAGPRARGDRQAMRVLLAARRGAVKARSAAINALKAMILTAPEALRADLGGLPTAEKISRCARARTHKSHTTEHRATILALRSVARRIQDLRTETHELDAELSTLVKAACPTILELPGVGPISAAELIVAWSHKGRIRNEAAFATLAGVAPIPASSGQTVRYRLSPHGDRRLNTAIHTIATTRRRCHRASQAYVAKRTADGKTSKDITRCLKRAIAREMFAHLNTYATPVNTT